MDILVDYGDFINDKSDPNDAYLVVLAEEGEESGNAWLGVMAGIRTALKKTAVDLKDDFNEKIGRIKNSINGEIELTRKEIKETRDEVQTLIAKQEKESAEIKTVISDLKQELLQAI